MQGFAQALSKEGVNADYPIHIKIDTGMHRLGFEADDIPELLARLKTEKRMKEQFTF